MVAYYLPVYAIHVIDTYCLRLCNDADWDGTVTEQNGHSLNSIYQYKSTFSKFSAVKENEIEKVIQFA